MQMVDGKKYPYTKAGKAAANKAAAKKVASKKAPAKKPSQTRVNNMDY